MAGHFSVRWTQLSHLLVATALAGGAGCGSASQSSATTAGGRGAQAGAHSEADQAGIAGVLGNASAGASTITDPCVAKGRGIFTALNREHQASRDCASDSDCILVPDKGDCWEGCDLPIATLHAAAYAAAVTEISNTLCPDYAACGTLRSKPTACLDTRAYCLNGKCWFGCPGQLDFDALDPTSPYCGSRKCSDISATSLGADPRTVSGEHCCTASGNCGAGSGLVFGNTCFDRDQAGTASPQCPDFGIHTIFDAGDGFNVVPQVKGCCRPDGLCGLHLGTAKSPSDLPIGVGCVERSALAAALRAGCVAGNRSIDLAPIACTQ